MPRADPDRHEQLRRPRRAGGAQGRGVRRDAARRGRHRGAPLRVHAGPHVGGGHVGRRRQPRAAAAPRPPRRRAGRGRGLAGRPVQRRGPGRLRVGPWRGRHEGLRRDAAVDRASAPASGAGARPSDRALLHRRRGGRWPPRRRGARRGAPRRVRGRDRGGRRGRRLQHHRARTPALPDRGRREGHGLDEAHRARASGSRLDDQPRQRRHPAVRARSRASGPTSGRCG